MDLGPELQQYTVYALCTLFILHRVRGPHFMGVRALLSFGTSILGILSSSTHRIYGLFQFSPSFTHFNRFSPRFTDFHLFVSHGGVLARRARAGHLFFLPFPTRACFCPHLTKQFGVPSRCV